jgi:hypothetical protein
MEAASRGWRSRLGTGAGPLLIVIVVLVVLHDFAFGGRISAQHPDVLAYWLPTHCYLGQSLAAGAIPTWNPHVLGGVPFAADPQSGWMYLPAMALYTVLPCAVALPWFITLQPIIAGLGAYAFLRSEAASRPAATTGGVVLALAMAGSSLTLALPFSGAVAWTMVLLAAASRYLRASAWGSRLLWLGATAVAWGQVAAAHLSDGLVIGTAALSSYAAVRLVTDLRAGRRSGRDALLAGVLLVAALPLVNLAYLLPRLAYLPRTSLAVGYEDISDAAARFGGRTPSSLPGPASEPAWPLQLATWPGAYLGAAALAVSLAWWRGPRGRAVPAAIAGYAAVCYVLSLEVVAVALKPLLLRVPLGSFYLHAPWRLRLGVVLAIPLLAAFGLDAWTSARRAAERAWMLVPGVLVWWLLPAMVADSARLALPAAGAALGGGAVWLVARRPELASFVPVVLAVELTAAAVLGQTFPRELVRSGVEPPEKTRPFTPLLAPDWSAADYLRPGAITAALPPAGVGRFYGRDRGTVDENGRGYLHAQRPRHWGLMVNQRAILFGLEDVQGYNPVQLRRSWLFVRAISAEDIRHNTAVVLDPPDVALQLLDVTAVVAPATELRGRGFPVVARQGRWGVARLPRESSRATVHTSWREVRDLDEALQRVLDPSFDPAEEVVLEGDPGIPRSPIPSPPRRAGFQWTGVGSAEVEVDAPAAGLLLVRNAYDPGWEATVDGREATVLPADFILQAVPVPAGRHTVRLRYHDPWVGYGLLGSSAAITALVAAGLALPRRPTPQRGGGGPPRSTAGDPPPALGRRRRSPPPSGGP